MSAESFSRGTRDNGLRCAGYTPVADLDPRIADAMLATLRSEGIAAYAAPTPAASGGYGELQLPPRPTDRLWVDTAQAERARGLLAEETADPVPGHTDVDFDAAWQQVLTSLRTPAGAQPEGSWPASENVDPTVTEVEDDDEPIGFDPADDEHYVPPTPPPLPRLRPATLAAVLSMALGLLVLAVDLDGGTFRVLAFAALVGGAVSLVWNMRQGPPTDSGWDDGAVV